MYPPNIEREILYCSLPGYTKFNIIHFCTDKLRPLVKARVLAVNIPQAKR